MNKNLNIVISAIKYCRDNDYVSVRLIQRVLSLSFADANIVIHQLQKLYLIGLKTSKLQHKVNSTMDKFVKKRLSTEFHKILKDIRNFENVLLKNLCWEGQINDLSLSSFN